MIVAPEIEAWLLAQQRKADPIEAAMRTAGEDRGFPIVGPLVGGLLDVLTRTSGAVRVFEMGSGFGYSTWWFARAVGPSGSVVHTDGDQALSDEARDWLTRAGMADRCGFVVGDALAALRDDDSVYDIVFIDVDKEQYPAAWKIARSKVGRGGLIITDNTLWSGRVAKRSERDPATAGVRAYVKAALHDAQFATTIIPLRDGVAVSVRL